MINFKKVFTMWTFSTTLCVLLLCETAVFAMPVSNTLRVPISPATNERISKAIDKLASNQVIKIIPSARGINLLFSKIEELKQGREPLLVCISGNAGAGKSAFAKLIANRISKSLVIRIDDFYTQVDGAFWVLNEKKVAGAINQNIKNGEYDVIIVEGFEAFSVARWLKAMNRKSFAGKRKAFDIHVRLIADDATRYNNIKQKQDLLPIDENEYMPDTDIWSYIQELHEGEDSKEKPDYIFDNSIGKRPTLASNETIKITDKSGNAYYIEKADPAEYPSLVRIFQKIYKEEMVLLKDNHDINGTIGVDMLNGLYTALMEEPEYKNILAFFVLRNSNGSIIGGRLFYKPKETQDAESKIVTGLDAIRYQYQDKGLGTQLRVITLRWLKEAGYDKYAARVYDYNKRSMGNLIKVGADLKATISLTEDPELYILELSDTIIPIVRQNFPNTKNISFADLDTGTGEFVTNFTNFLKRHYNNVDGIGLEMLGVLTEQAKANGHNVVHGTPEAQEDYENAGLTDSSKDIVTINNIESRPWVLIAQADRILKPNGLLIVTFEKYDILESRDIDKSVESDLINRGYLVKRMPFPADYPHSVMFQEADFILVGQKVNVKSMSNHAIEALNSSL